jgi:hypothetical protein
MASARQQLEEHLLDLAWSLWTELGVAGVVRKHRQCAIMPEDLLLLTSALSSVDPRLRDESIDWCCSYQGYVSTARLRSLFKRSCEQQQASFSPFAATVNHLAGTRWPAADEARPWSVGLSGKSRLPLVTRPALLHLRLRALFGTGARADVIANLLGHDSLDVSVAEVAQIGYTKRNIANVLGDLEAAGLLVSHTVQNQLRYRWARRAALKDLVQPLPRSIPAWRQIVGLVLRLYWFIERTEPKASVVRSVEAAKILPSIEQQAAALHWRRPRPGRRPEMIWEELGRWAVKIARAVAAGSMTQMKNLTT